MSEFYEPNDSNFEVVGNYLNVPIYRYNVDSFTYWYGELIEENASGFLSIEDTYPFIKSDLKEVERLKIL